jgi:hypothetical protein
MNLHEDLLLDDRRRRREDKCAAGPDRRHGGGHHLDPGASRLDQTAGIEHPKSADLCDQASLGQSISRSS